MKNVLILTDFSNTARNAALYALKMFKDDDVEFNLLNAYDLEFSGSPYVMQVKEEMAYESEKGLKQEKTLLKRIFPQADVQTLSGFGSLIDVVHQFIQKNHPDLTVLGCRGESALENFLLGSNAYEVIKSIKAPILVVPKSAEFRKPEKIVFATDLKDIAKDEVMNPVRDIVDRYRSSLMFVNVLDDEYVNRLDAENKIATHFPNIDLSFNFIEGDDVSKSINRFMDDNDAEMVAMVRHDVGFFDRIFHPSITKQMVLHPEHPMLILHDELE
ncbi:universal stress protein [Labilibacter marinus]|uniref:universal stress protein n=1 Tax=Labilibacter marinus TaxID=1477105 RepID=UPI0008327E3E|nr:universal stress protein [Labilibacter marinus]